MWISHSCVAAAFIVCSVFLPAGAQSPSGVTGIVPDAAPAGARVIVTGSAVESIEVSFSTGTVARVNARVENRSASTLEVTVPSTAASGPVRILHAGQTIATFDFTVTAVPPVAAVATLIRGGDQLNAPAGVAATLDGRVYVADTRGHRIRCLLPDGTFRIIAGSGRQGLLDGTGVAAEFAQPYGIAFDASRNLLYVADSLNHVIRRVTAEGIVMTIAGRGQPGDRDGFGAAASFHTPAGIALDVDGNLYVADSGNHKIRRVDPAGAVTTFAGTGLPSFVDGVSSVAGFHRPEGVVVDARGIVYVADTLNHAIRAVATGVVTTVAGSGSPGDADGVAPRFASPRGVALTAGGNLLVSDSGNHVLRELDLATGTASTIAGIRHPGLSDGPVSVAAFHSPHTVAQAGALYVADTGNNALRVLYPQLRGTAIYPRFGPVAGGNVMRVFGTGFVAGQTSVRVGGAAANDVTLVDSTELLVTVPSGAAGAVNLTITTPAGTVTLERAYAYLDRPTITSVIPSRGRTAGGEAVTIHGGSFVADQTTVTFGGVASPNVFVTDGIEIVPSVSVGSLITATTPPGTPGHADVTVATAAGTATAPKEFRYADPPRIIQFTPPSGLSGTSVAILGQHFESAPSQNRIRFGSAVATVIEATSTQLAVIVPEGASTAAITVETSGGIAQAATVFVVPVLTSVGVTPLSVSLSPGETAALHASAAWSDDTTRDVTASAIWMSSNPAVVAVDSSGRVTATSGGRAEVRASFGGLSAVAVVTVEEDSLPPDPATVAPPFDPSRASGFAEGVAFLYEGANPIQREVAAGAIDSVRVAVLRGRVVDRDGTPLSGARVQVASTPELGYTLSRADGWFDLAVNGGGAVTLDYTKAGYLRVHRTLQSDWHRFAIADDVVMTALDANVATINFSGAASHQVVRSTVSNDDDGQRRATLLFAPQTTAALVMPDGTKVPILTGGVRATEFTVGPRGRNAMPAPLPATSAYTYCVELSVDEAMTAGAGSVEFSKPVAVYVENFLGFATGEPVPVGYYDRRKGMWIAVPNGKVIRIVSTNGGLASVDTDGDGAGDADSALAAIGITIAERERLATLYDAGTALWRFTVTHFTPYDANWPTSAELARGRRPGKRRVRSDRQLDDACRYSGSQIDCENQTLGERLPIGGTAFTLAYSSARVPGRSSARTMTISLTDDVLPETLAKVHLTIDVAGKRYTRSVDAAPNMEEIFTWDGDDAYGRKLQGAQDVAVYVGYEYPVLYRRPGATLGFGEYSNGPGLLLARTPFELVDEQHTQFLPWDARGAGLGGWTIDAHHTFDVGGNRVLHGDGSARTGDGGAGTIRSIVGTPPNASVCANTNGRPGSQVTIHKPRGIAALPDGSVVFADQSCGLLLKVMRDGIVTEAAARQFSSAHGVAAAPDGTMYVSEMNTGRVFRVDRDRAATVYAGTGTNGFSGDGGPATSAQLHTPTILAVAPDGTLHIVDSFNGRIRKVTADGSMITAAGDGSWDIGPDGVSALSTGLGDVRSITFGADGTLYFVSDFEDHVFAIAADGTLRRFARVCEPECGGRANLGSIAAAPDGSLYVTRFYSNVFRIHRIERDGSTTIVADGQNGPTQETPSDRSFGGDDGPAIGAFYSAPTALAIGPDGAIYLTDTGNRRVRRITPSLARGSTELTLASPDGSALLVFDREGRHLRTIDGRTGAVLAHFGYAGGKLTAIMDIDGNRTTIAREGTSIMITAPGGQQTNLTTDAQGWLQQVTNDSEESWTVVHDPDGLLRELRDPKQQVSILSYDSLGRLFRDHDRAGGVQELALTDLGTRFTVSRRTLLGRTTTHATEWLTTGERKRTTTSPAGQVSTAVRRPSADLSFTDFDGTVVESSIGAHPRFGTQALFTKSRFVLLPQGGAVAIEQELTATGVSPSNPLSFSEEKRTVRINGKAYTWTYASADRSMTVRTPLGRIVKSFFDAKGRAARVDVPGSAPLNVTYDSGGRLKTVNQAGRTQSFDYNGRNELTGIHEARGLTAAFTYDDAGRPLEQTLPGNRIVTFTYDANGNVRTITPPDSESYSFTWNGRNQMTAWEAPLSVTHFVYNADGDVESIELPDSSLVTFGYDVAGRIKTLSAPHGKYDFGYDGTTGRLQSVSAPAGDAALAWTWNGPLITAVTWTGAVSGTVQYGYNADLGLERETVNGSAVTFGYDSDGLLTRAGSLALVRHPATGMVTATTLGTVSDSYAYNQYGEPENYTVTASGTSVFQQIVLRDGAGRVERLTETATGVTTVREYGYDTAGRLQTVTINGMQATTYAYDSNGNRLSRAAGSTNEVGTYDAEDRLLTYGDATYTYTSNGALLTREDENGKTTYEYDAFGALRAVTLPDGRKVEYLVDSQGRRVGKKLAGTVVQAWLYSDDLRVAAELDGTGKVVSRFVYASRTNVPDYVIRNGVAFRIISDQIGSPRLVINSSDSAIVQRVEYDEFGRVVYDSNPGFQPFGFAGGLRDADTGLVRFGARDYDPQSGRWTAKDPMLFRGGSNLYRYAHADPVNLIDPEGKVPVPVITGIIGSAAGAIGSVAMQLWTNRSAGFGALACIDWGDVGIAAGTGFLAGFAAPFTATTWLGAIGTSALANEVQYVATEVSNGRSPEVEGALWAVGTGAVAGGVGGKFSPVSAGYNAESVITSDAQRKVFKQLNDNATNASQVATENLLRNTGGNLAAGAPAPGSGAGGCGCP